MTTQRLEEIMREVNSPPDDPPIVMETQYPNKPCHPLAIHDKYPPIDVPPASVPRK